MYSVFNTVLRLFSICMLLGWYSANSATVLRVGVYQNPPKIQLDEQGKPAGIFIDLLREIARNEQWALEFRVCDWSFCLEELRKGDLDLLPDVAYTPERSRTMDFHRHPALGSWSQIYAHPRLNINQLRDLQGRTLAVLSNSIQQESFRIHLETFQVHAHLVSFPSFGDAFRAVAEKRADAVIANHLAGDILALHYALVRTPVVFQPTSLYFAAPLGRHPKILEIIDRHLSDWHQTPGSPYYRSLAKWMVVSTPQGVPAYWIWIAWSIFTALALTSLGAYLLRRQVRQRTRELIAEQVHSQQQAEQLALSQKTESLGRLARGIAHDFNNYIGLIVGNVELAQMQGCDQGPCAAQLEDILKAAKKSQAIIAQLLSYARHQPIAPQIIDINHSIRDMQTMLQRMIGHEHNLVLSLASVPCPIEIDPSQLDQILSNLCINARDALDPGGTVFIATLFAVLPPVGCQLHPESSSNGFVELRVRDTGSGIDANSMRSIFEPFFTTKPEGLGTGLGLATVHAILQQNHGGLHVSSSPSAGTTFRLFFPHRNLA